MALRDARNQLMKEKLAIELFKAENEKEKLELGEKREDGRQTTQDAQLKLMAAIMAKLEKQ